jgi:Tol biopolymer transport system component
MNPILRTLLIFTLGVLNCIAQPMRLELLTRSDDHARRKGGAARSAVPEFSRDGNYVLFLSEAANLTPHTPETKRALQVYMVDRRTRQATLLPAGTNGLPANDHVSNFEVSANNRRVLIETAASNLVADDTNKVTDIFVRDLDRNTNIPVSVNTNGVLSQRGGMFGTMSADGNVVAFVSSDKTLAAGSSSAANDIYVRNIAAATTERLPAPAGYVAVFFSDPSVSDDGRYVAFGLTATIPNTFGSVSMSALHDLETHTTVRLAKEAPGSAYEPIMTPDGKFVTFGIFNFASATPTNVIVRCATDTGSTELVASNSFRTVTRPIAISNNGRSILYFEQNGFRVYREGLETRVFPRNSDGTPITLPVLFGSAAMSSDGRAVTFSTDVPLLAAHGEVSQFRTYVYDVEQDTLAEIPMTSFAAPMSDPVPNADGSMVVFTAADAGLQDETEPATHNVYLWERSTGNTTLLSQSHFAAFENSGLSDSMLWETGAFSEDGNKLVFASRSPASGVTDTNNTWDIFVLDRTTGQKQLVSVAMDGLSSGSSLSMRPAISGDGRVVAFFSRATNLVAIPTSGRNEQLYVRDLVKGITYLAPNQNGLPTVGEHQRKVPSLSYDGRRVVFMSNARDLDSHATGGNHAYVFDVPSNKVSMVSYNTDTTAFGIALSAVISRDGALVAYRGDSIASSVNTKVYVRTIDTGELRLAPTPSSQTGTPGYPPMVKFNADSTLLFYGSLPSYILSWDLSSASPTVLGNLAADADFSRDGRWIAMLRKETSQPFRTQVWLRDSLNRTETLITSNVVSHAIGNDRSYRAKISSDGRFTVFQSRASNLVTNDVNGATDIFVYDRDRNQLDLISATAGANADATSLRPVVSPDQRSVAFVSFASNLVPHDFNQGSDIFAAYFPAADTDSDGIDDPWELAEFGNLEHDMTADTDGDGCPTRRSSRRKPIQNRLRRICA